MAETHVANDWHDPANVTRLPAPAAEDLPRRLMYATSSGLGGTGLDTTALEGAKAAQASGFLKEVVCFGTQQSVIPRSKIHSLQWHPVRLLSGLGSQDYYGAKKHYAAMSAARRLRRRDFDCLHGWSGDCFRALVEARLASVPSVMDVPTWHRNKGLKKSAETLSEREMRLGTGSAFQRWRASLPIPRLQMLAEYDLVDLLLMPSRASGETFLAAGIPESRLHYVGRGVDVARYTPGTPPQDVFRAIFVGALIERKGVHHLLAAWKKLALKNAELVLVGAVHNEIKAVLAANAGDSVRVMGFCKDVGAELRRSSVFVFPSECEGFAKTTLEAAACGLPLIATAESGDAVVDGQTGHLIPANDPEALAAALRSAYENRDRLEAMGRAGRQRVEDVFTWDHYRARILQGYARVMKGRPA
ncbi:MAG: glycosyltransferase family 4 protein [Verrucomicrobiaceae bacterium]|nr:glycosyltransferase family 4 protein [Verrucomicrobiaceae bacterium]